MKVIFRVDASLQMGTGHIMRCLTLAQALKEKGANVEFICRKHEGNLIDKIRSNGFVVHELKMFEETKVDTKLAHSHWLGATQEQDARQTIKVIPKNTDLLIVDSYALDEEWHQRLRYHTNKIMVIDDLADRQFDCDILLNQNLGSQKEDYQDKVPDNIKLLLGCNYALLRPEFAEFRDQALKKRKNTKKIKNILVSVGGSDTENLTHEILQSLDGFNVVVVLGETSPYNDMIKSYAKERNIEVIVNANNMAELMLDADLAIGAGGSTSWERCCLGLPTLLYITADNQRKIAEELEKLSATIIVKNLKDDLQIMIDNFGLWQSMSDKAKNICDGKGVVNTIKLIQ